MKRLLKQLACMTAAVLLAVSSFPAAAMASEGFTGEDERLIDMADLLTYEEESELLETLNEISERQKMDIVLITSEDMDGYSDIQEYADDLYDYCDYGYGANRDGLLLLISMAESEWYISTCGQRRSSIFKKGSAPCSVVTTGTSYLYCDWSGRSLSYSGQHEGSAENCA